MSRRAKELTTALGTHRRERTAIVTFTLRHHAGIPLDVLRTLLARAYSEMWAGNGGAKLRAELGVVGHVRSAEQTWGENGWHPHLHALLFFRNGPHEHLQDLLTERWLRVVSQLYGRLVRAAKRAAHCEESATERAAAVRLLGVRFARPGKLNAGGKRFLESMGNMGGLVGVLPSTEHAVKAERVDSEDAGKYLAKMGLELTGVLQKAGKGEHFTHWQIGQAAAAGQRWAQPLWSEHADAMKGARQLTWARGTRKLVGLRPERPDEVLASEKVPEPQDVDTPLRVIDAQQWDHYARSARQLFIAELHDRYANGDFGDVGHTPWTETIERVRPEPEPAPVWWTLLQREARSRERGARVWSIHVAEVDGRKKRRSLGFDHLERHEVLQEVREFLCLDMGLLGAGSDDCPF